METLQKIAADPLLEEQRAAVAGLLRQKLGDELLADLAAAPPDLGAGDIALIMAQVAGDTHDAGTGGCETCSGIGGCDTCSGVSKPK